MIFIYTYMHTYIYYIALATCLLSTSKFYFLFAQIFFFWVCYINLHGRIWKMLREYSSKIQRMSRCLFDRVLGSLTTHVSLARTACKIPNDGCQLSITNKDWNGNQFILYPAQGQAVAKLFMLSACLNHYMIHARKKCSAWVRYGSR